MYNMLHYPSRHHAAAVEPNIKSGLDNDDDDDGDDNDNEAGDKDTTNADQIASPPSTKAKATKTTTVSSSNHNHNNNSSSSVIPLTLSAMLYGMRYPSSIVTESSFITSHVHASAPSIMTHGLSLLMWRMNFVSGTMKHWTLPQVQEACKMMWDLCINCHHDH
jgi:hypothetical protein